MFLVHLLKIRSRSLRLFIRGDFGTLGTAWEALRSPQQNKNDRGQTPRLPLTHVLSVRLPLA